MIDPTWIKAGSDILSAAVATPPPAPTYSTGTQSINGSVNNYGWSVATGKGSASQTLSGTGAGAMTPTQEAAVGATPMGATQTASSWLIALVAIPLLFAAFKKTKSG